MRRLRLAVGGAPRGPGADEARTRRAAVVAKATSATVIALIAVRALSGALEAMPAHITRAIQAETEERRQQHQELRGDFRELRGDLRELATALRDRHQADAQGGEADAAFRATVVGLAQGRFRCPDCRCPPSRPCPPQQVAVLQPQPTTAPAVPSTQPERMRGP